LTGGKKREDIFEGFQKIRVILEKYRIEWLINYFYFIIFFINNYK
jgi:hypothetical protein